MFLIGRSVRIGTLSPKQANLPKGGDASAVCAKCAGEDLGAGPHNTAALPKMTCFGMCGFALSQSDSPHYQKLVLLRRSLCHEGDC